MTKKTFLYSVFVALFFVLVVQVPAGLAANNDYDYDLSRTIKPAPPESVFVYESAIVPWLQREFATSAFIKNGSFISRNLKKTALMRYETIDGQERYNVHIEYNVHIKDVSGVELEGIKGQEIVFWVKNGRVRDYFPFDEYWIKRQVSYEEIYY